MPAKRIIPCLDVKNGQTVKGINFENLKYAGNPVQLAAKYYKDGADELVFLDITASIEGRKSAADIAEQTAKQVFIPFTFGGGIRTIEDIRTLLTAGADKTAVNSAAVKNPDFINQAANYFGSQCITAAIDAKKIDNDYYVFINGGRINSGKRLIDWVKEVQERGAGEILLTSMDADGTQNGFDIQMTKLVCENANVPVIASGGAGAEAEHFVQVFKQAGADAALAASIFHYDTLPVPVLKQKLLNRNIEIRREYAQMQ